MALLVFTDFICWAPIAFFSLTAVCGAQLVSLEEAKVFAIFVLPLNSCANPFLYAIFTKQFKKDCIHICKRIEESRVTRGIGRGRHSSNFSNIHAPIGTNLGGIASPFLASNSENSQEKIPNLEHEVCNCGVNWKPVESPDKKWKLWALKYLLCQKNNDKDGAQNSFTYAIGRVQRRNERRNKHASSISSENFSSRSDSWRQVNIPMRLIHRDNGKCSWKFHRKASQDSNASCSRQDSSTSTFRMSHSSFSSDASTHHKPWCPSHPAAAVPNCERECHVAIGRDGKPKLCRQSAVEEALSTKRCIKTYHSSMENSENPKPSTERQNERLCTLCSRTNASGFTIIYKSEDSGGKVECYHNKLTEAPSENNDDELSSKDEKKCLLEGKFPTLRDCKISCSQKQESLCQNMLPGVPNPKIRSDDHSSSKQVVSANSNMNSSNTSNTPHHNSCDPIVPYFQQKAEILSSDDKCRSLTCVSEKPFLTKEATSASADSFCGTSIKRTNASSQETLAKERVKSEKPMVKRFSLEEQSENILLDNATENSISFPCNSESENKSTKRTACHGSTQSEVLANEHSHEHNEK